MITKIRGKLLLVQGEQATLEVDAFEYQVLITEFTRRQLQSSQGQTVSLHTIHYMEGNPQQGRMSPRLVGFNSEIEREFFELFCSVDGVGVKKALRAMVRPVRDVATLIEEQDSKGLSALPGIGPATAERVIAKLRRKMPRFALLVAGQDVADGDVKSDVIQEAFAALQALGHSETESRKLIDVVVETKKKFKDVESMLQAIYQQSK